VLYPRQRRSGDGGADYGFPQLRLLRFFGGMESLGMRYSRLGLRRRKRVKEEHGAESPQLAFCICCVLGFKSFPGLGELGFIFRKDSQFSAGQVTRNEAPGAEFAYQDGMAFRGKSLVQMIVRTAFYKRRDFIAAYVEMGRQGRGKRDCHD
jgi:hypothetical protein